MQKSNFGTRTTHSSTAMMLLNVCIDNGPTTADPASHSSRLCVWFSLAFVVCCKEWLCSSAGPMIELLPVICQFAASDGWLATNRSERQDRDRHHLGWQWQVATLCREKESAYAIHLSMSLASASTWKRRMSANKKSVTSDMLSWLAVAVSKGRQFRYYYLAILYTMRNGCRIASSSRGVKNKNRIQWQSVEARRKLLRGRWKYVRTRVERWMDGTGMGSYS